MGKIKQILVIIFSLVACHSVQAFEIDGLRYDISPDGNVAVIEGFDYTSTERSKVLEIPDSVPTPEYMNAGKVPVVAVGVGAFYRSEIEKVRIPDTVKEIMEAAFAECNSLSVVEGGKNLNFIGNNAFYSTPLTEVEFGENIHSIGSYVFFSTTLEEIELGEHINSIGACAFYRCPLRRIKIDAEVPPVCDYNSFGFGRDNPYFFKECELVVPEEVVKAYMIDSYWVQFYQNQDIGEFSYFLNFLDNTVSLRGYTNEADHKKNLSFPSEVEFWGEKYIVTSVGGFDGEEMLESIEFGDKTTTIRGSAFKNCINLSNIIFPNGLIYIGSDAFFGCENLKTILLPSTLTGIGSEAFAKTALEEIECKAMTPPDASEAFSRRTCANANLIIDSECEKEYEEADGWGDFWNCVEAAGLIYRVNKAEGTASVTYELKGGQWNYAGVTEANVLPVVYLDNKKYDVRYVGENAFSQLTEVYTEVTPDDILRSPGDEPEHIMKVELPSSILEIGKGAFSYSYVEEVVLNEGLKLIEQEAFAYSDIKSITIPSTVLSLQEKAFDSCSELKEVILGSSLKFIGAGAFSQCSELRSIVCRSMVPPTVSSEDSFSYDVYQEAVLTVPEEAFYDYKADTVWSKFQIMEKTGIETIETDEVKAGDIKGVYDISGNRISDGIDGLSQGVYIIVTRDKSFKIYVPTHIK